MSGWRSWRYEKKILVVNFSTCVIERGLLCISGVGIGMSLNSMYYTLNEFLILKSYDPLLLSAGGRLIIGSHDNQNTTNLTNSIRGQHVDGPRRQAGLTHSDKSGPYSK